MSRHDDESLLGRLRAGLLDSVDAELSIDPPRADFDAMMARVRDLDADVAERYGSSDVEDAPSADDAPVDEAHIGDDDPMAGAEARDRVALAPWVQALRERVDVNIALRRQAGPWPVPSRPQRSQTAWVVLSTIGVAAAAVALALNSDLLRGGESKDGVLASMAAADTAQRASWSGDATVRGSTNNARRSASELAPPGEPDLEGVDLVVDDSGDGGTSQSDEEFIDLDEDEVVPVVRARPAKRRAAPSLDDLDARAQAHWRAGRLRAAEAAFRQLVAKGGGDDARVELAYAELFALVRQRGGDLSAVWRRYLQAFPRGRYASDAQAGLCRRALGEAREQCWQDYRTRFPKGIHAPDDRP